MPDSKIIEIMLVDGDPAGIRVVTIANWAGIALATYRSDLAKFLEREELERPAVYFLTGKDAENGKTAMYVGESDSFRQRIKGHADKNFWDQAVVFTSNDGRFNKATVKYLEASFYDGMEKAGRVIVMNGNRPRGVSLGESDTSIANEYKRNARIVLGVLGFIDIDVPLSPSARQLKEKAEPVVFSAPPQRPVVQVADDVTFVLKRVKCDARMRVATDGYVVLAGSIMNRDNPRYMDGELDPKHMLISLYERRHSLVKEGKISERDGMLVLNVDQTFEKSSSAAEFVIGAPASGNNEWKTPDGRMLKEVELKMTR